MSRQPQLNLHRQKLPLALRALAMVLSLGIFLTSVPTNSFAAVASDISQACQLNITSGSSSSVLVTKYSNKCVAQFKGVGSYTFTVPTSASQIDYLIVAGGGGGASGGGGAGGLLQGINYSVTPNTSASVTVGGGGVGGNGGGTSQSGANSLLLGMTSIGGGGGVQTGTSTSGGSGGGGGYDQRGTRGNPTAGQGFAGGTSQFGGYGGGAGGGGAGAVGTGSPYSHIGGDGGNGIANSITGTSVYYAGGGGGGINANSDQYHDQNNGVSFTSYLATEGNRIAITKGGGQGGLGGGGRGSSFGKASSFGWSNALAGEANTGGGGGGTDPEDTGGMAGGSGIVIISWAGSVAPTFYSFTVSGVIYKGRNSVITVELNAAGKITLLASGKKIPNCIALSTYSTSPSFSASCNWKPSKTGSVVITAQYSESAGSPVYTSGSANFVAIKRTNSR